MAARSASQLPFYYYLVLPAIVIGYLLRERSWIDPSHGFGYWLGILGASMMLVLLVYPFRKRFRVLRFLGSVPVWFNLHMLFGLFGPLLILYHGNFGASSANSRIALTCMLVVAGSGLIGRHLYALIHHGLHGRKATLEEMRGELSVEAADAEQATASSDASLPRLHAALASLATSTLEHHSAQRRGAAPVADRFARRGSAFGWLLGRPLLRRRLRALARADLREQGLGRPALRQSLRQATRHIDRQLVSMRKVEVFHLYERLFFLWHVLHLPLVFLLVLSAIAHVIAVHMY